MSEFGPVVATIWKRFYLYRYPDYADRVRHELYAPVQDAVWYEVANLCRGKIQAQSIIDYYISHGENKPSSFL